MWHWRMFLFSSSVVFLMRWKRELLCLMWCADPSLSSTTSGATPASSTSEPLPIKPIRAWRDPPRHHHTITTSGDERGDGRQEGERESRITQGGMEGRKRAEISGSGGGIKSFKSHSMTSLKDTRTPRRHRKLPSLSEGNHNTPR